MLTIRKERRTAMRHLVNKCSRRIICRLPQKREEGVTQKPRGFAVILLLRI